ERRALDRIQANATDADHGHALEWPYLGTVDHGAKAGQHAAAKQAGNLHGQVVGHLCGLELVDHGVLGQTADGSSELHERLALLVAVMRPGPLLVLAHVAQAEHAVQAAAAAAGDRRHDHVVAWLDRGDAIADLLDHSRALVA